MLELVFLPKPGTKQFEKTISNNTITIPMEHLDNGIYLLEPVSKQGVIIKQFVVEHGSTVQHTLKRQSVKAAFFCLNN